MSNEIHVTGNVGRKPEVRKAGDKNVVEFTLYCDEYRRNSEGQWEQDDDRGEWYRVTVWLEKLGEQVVQHLREGARVTAVGHLTVNRWKDRKSSEPRFELAINVDEVMLNFSRVEEVRFRAKRLQREASAAVGS